MPNRFDLNASRIRAFIISYFNSGPLSFIDGNLIDNISDNLIENGSRSFSMITDHKDFSAHIANRIFVETPFSKKKTREILDKVDILHPNNYLEILESQGIPNHTFTHLKNKNWELFINTRFESLKDKEIEFMKSKGVVPPLNNDDNPVEIWIG